MVWRQQYPYPVIVQTLFAVSFVLFLLFYDRLPRFPGGRAWLWGWCGLQIVLGLMLVQRRLRAKKLILRCIRCG
jgi:hypothetical protein